MSRRPTSALMLFIRLIALTSAFAVFVPASAMAAPTLQSPLPSSLKGDSYSTSPLGYKAAVRFAQDLGYDTHVLRDPNGTRFTAEDTVLLFDPTIRDGLSREARTALDLYLESEATLIVSLPKRYAALTDVTGTALRETGLIHEHELRFLLSSLGLFARTVRDDGPSPSDTPEPQSDAEGLRPEAEALQRLQGVGSGWEILVGDETRAVLIRGERYNGAPVYILSDSDIVANHGLARGDNAAIYQSLLRAAVRSEGQLYVDEAFHGYLARYTPLYAATRFPGSLLSLQILLLALLFLWRAATHLRVQKPSEVVVEDTGYSLAESVGELLSENLRTDQNLRRFRGLVVQSALDRSGGRNGLSEFERLAQLESLRTPTLRLEELDQQLASLPARPNTQRILRLARSYQRWFSEVIDGTP